jgi:hypothetical protein
MSEFYVPRGKHEASSKLRTQKYWVPLYKIKSPGILCILAARVCYFVFAGCPVQIISIYFVFLILNFA